MLLSYSLWFDFYVDMDVESAIVGIVRRSDRCGLQGKGADVFRNDNMPIELDWFILALDGYARDDYRCV